MRRALIAVLVASVMGPCMAGAPQPSDAMLADARALFVRLAARGDAPESIARIIAGYFGQDIDIRSDGAGGTDFRLSRRDPKTGDLTFWTLIGSLKKPVDNAATTANENLATETRTDHPFVQ